MHAIRVKDFRGAVSAVRDFESFFGDSAGDDLIALALTDLDTLDAAAKRVRFVASDDSIDLQDEIIAAGAFHDLRSAYLRNPVLLAGHQHRLDNGMSAAVGKTVELSTDKNPLVGVGEFINTAAGRDHAEAVLSGAQRGVSVGFRAREHERREGRVVHTKALLLEISFVPVPANLNALVLSYAAGQLQARGIKSADSGETRELLAAVRELRAELDALKAGRAIDDAVDAMPHGRRQVNSPSADDRVFGLVRDAFAADSDGGPDPCPDDPFPAGCSEYNGERVRDAAHLEELFVKECLAAGAQLSGGRDKKDAASTSAGPKR